MEHAKNYSSRRNTNSKPNFREWRHPCFCNQQALKILRNDGITTNLKYLNNYLEVINRGVLWADRGWKYLSHYYDPVTDSGLGPLPDARLEFNYYFDKSLSLWHRGNKKKALFFLGVSVHLVQDLCVPHHSNGIAFCGHQEYEKWVNNNYKLFLSIQTEFTTALHPRLSG